MSSAPPGLLIHSTLIVDDDQVTTELFSALLRDWVIADIETASDGDHALAVLARRDVDLVICDLNMPGMDGAVLTKHLAALPHRPALILISGEDLRVLEAGMRLAVARGLVVLGFLQKPIDRSRLLELLRAYRPAERGSQGFADRFAMMDEQCLRDGLIKGIHRLVYQPKVDLRSGALSGVEALLRWHDPVHGDIAPQEVVDVAERHHCIDELTLSILERAALDRSKFADAGVAVNVAVNVSLRNLRNEGMVEKIIDAVATQGNAPSDFTLEITETHLVEDLATALEMLIRLRMSGFHVALDDYGTGASTMQFLQQFPSTEMKIDRSFVAAAPLSDQGRAFLSTAADLGKRLGQVVVAEGIETEREMALASEVGCDQGQGYYFCRPLPVDGLLEWVHARAA